MRKTIIAVTVVLLLAGVVIAGVVDYGAVSEGDVLNFAWDASMETDLAGYRIYRFDTETGNLFGESSPNLIADIQCGGGNTSVACTTYQTNTTPVGTWFWKLTAYDTAGLESAEAVNILKRTVVAYNPPPALPSNFRFEATP